MKNPLAVFTGAALATLAALAGLNMTNWPAGSTGGEKAAETAGEAQKPAQEAGKTPEKPAAEEASKTPEKPAEIAAVPAPEPPKTESGVTPEFDTVRVEKDGQAVVAGRAEPGAEISLKLGDQVIGKGIAGSDGSWVVVPDSPLPQGAHELTIEQKTADSAPVTSAQSVAVAVPEKAGQQAMVALTEPGTATKVLQSGGGQQQASASETEKPATPEQQAKAAETAEKPPEAGQAAGAAQESPNGEPAATAEEQSESTEPAKQAEEPAAQTTTMAKTEELPEAVKPAETAPPTAEPVTAAVPLRLDAVDYNDKGDIIFSGRAKPGTAIRLYVDNGRVGDAMVDAQGNWSFSGKDVIAPGTHDLRADQIDATGKVMARIELPFLRENAEAVAALNTQPELEKTEARPAEPAEEQPPQPAQPQTTETQPVEPAEDQSPQPAQPPQTTEARPAEDRPPQMKEVQPPQTETQEVLQQTADVQPPRTTETTKIQPEASGPAPEQPVAEDKKEEVTTAVAAAAEQAAKAIDPGKPRSGRVIIQPGNNLWKLSRVIYGRGINFTVIYQANKDQIRDPDRIYPGQIFAIPNATPPEMIDPKRKDPLTSAEGGAVQ